VRQPNELKRVVEPATTNPPGVVPTPPGAARASIETREPEPTPSPEPVAPISARVVGWTEVSIPRYRDHLAQLAERYQQELITVQAEVDTRQAALKTGLNALKEHLGFLAAEVEHLPSSVTIYADLRPTPEPGVDRVNVLAADKRDLTAVAKGERALQAPAREHQREEGERTFHEIEKRRQAYRGMER